MEKILEVSGLSKSFYKHSFTFQKVQILKDISFSIPKGSVTGFLGANGSGKTTTIKCLFGLAHPDSGNISFFESGPLSKTSRQKIGFLPERPYFYEYLTGEEFLRFYGELSADKIDLNKKVAYLLDRVGLNHAKNRALRHYSKGMLQRVGIAQALIHDPQFIILDEPMTGLDPDGRFEIMEIIKETAARGTTVFFSSHLLNDIEQVCNYLVILKKGQKIYSGTTQDFLGQLKQSYYLKWLASNGNIKDEEVGELDKLQARLDDLRREGQTILEVNNKRMSLEQAFVNIAIDR